MSNQVNVFIIDDSAVVRQVVTEVLNAAPGINVIGSAPDPLFAMEKMKRQWPNVIVLDIEMPRMDGITFLRKIMVERPTPVVICSTITQEGAATTMQAFESGAVAVVPKPDIGSRRKQMEDAATDLTHAVRTAAQANIRHLGKGKPASSIHPAKLTADAVLHLDRHAMAQTTERIVAIGTSTGGTQALESVLSALPRMSPGIVVVQHMPEKFTAAFAARLNTICQIEVREAKNGDRIVPGTALIAPGGRHMMVRRSGAQYHAEVVDGPLVNRHRPSVDVLFRSVAKFAGKNALGVIMTGMGDDGARGMKEMRDEGAQTIAQDESSCVVFGMPKEAIKLGCVESVVSLTEIPGVMMKFFGRNT